jgi:hypothetical protein
MVRRALMFVVSLNSTINQRSRSLRPKTLSMHIYVQAENWAIRAICKQVDYKNELFMEPYFIV